MPASKLTRVALDQDRVIASGTVRIDGILVSNATEEDIVVLFKDSDGANKLDMAVKGKDSQTFETSFISENGWTADSVFYSGVVVTVAHGADGA